ncbi:MAG: serine/threonine protein kinase [Planctomycetes bacterium]|nr:serine/threonine protein kinase [Planctomycetota bacterium]
MTGRPDSRSSNVPFDPRLEQVVTSFLERCRRGERPSISEYTAGHPELAEKIREYFPGLLLLEGFQKSGASGSETALTPEGEAPSTARPPGRLGEYRLLREIGRRGMGIVYEAEQESLNRRVALKVLPFHSFLDSKRLERFRREAKAAARLKHPHIVPVFETGEEAGIHFYAMQYIVGENLAQKKRELGIEAAARLGFQAAGALEHAHAMGVLHRDIKPPNLLLDRSGAVWVTDFGLAKFEEDEDMTQSSEIAGTFRDHHASRGGARRRSGSRAARSRPARRSSGGASPFSRTVMTTGSRTTRTSRAARASTATETASPTSATSRARARTAIKTASRTVATCV